jgi:hypothetical protein
MMVEMMVERMVVRLVGWMVDYWAAMLVVQKESLLVELSVAHLVDLLEYY